MKGLIFNEPMVKAWLGGRKTVTRRRMNPQPTEGAKYAGMNVYGEAIFYPRDDTEDAGLRKPPYRPGETVYIKETWKSDNHFEGGGIPRLGIKYGKGCQWKVGNPDQSGPWKSPRFMPEWASRSHAPIIQSVRPERAQDSTLDECLADKISEESWERNDWVWRIELKEEGK